MNKEKKFIAWDKEEKRFLQPDEFFIGASGCVYRMIDSFDITDKTILIQYTNLEDKNGKEIYFNCSIITDGMTTTIVKWNSWSLLDDIENGVGDWKIIGTIYENRELLGDEKNE